MHLPDSATANRRAENLWIDATRSSGAEIDKLLESLIYDRAESITVTTIHGSVTLKSPKEVETFWKGFNIGRHYANFTE